MRRGVQFGATSGASRCGCLHDRAHFLRHVEALPSLFLFTNPVVSSSLIEMGLAVTTRIDALIWKVAIALLTAQLCSNVTQGDIPAFSELVCWSLVSVCLGALPWFYNDIWQDFKTLLIIRSPLFWWTTAASVAATTVSFSFENGAWMYVSI